MSKRNISTERLFLRRFMDSDFERYCEILSHNEVTMWLGRGDRKNKEDVRKIMTSYQSYWDNNNHGVWAVVREDDNELIGHCGIRYLDAIGEIELLYAFDPNYWNKGYATESVKAVIKYAKEELKLEKLVAIVYPNNSKSCNVIEKQGFDFKGEKELFGINLFYYDLELN